MDEAIMNHMKRTYNLMVGEQTAERIKIDIGSASPMDKEMSMEVRGARHDLRPSSARRWSRARKCARRSWSR
jgi:actin-like ATPase involved in cell morphogenesis